MRDNPNQPQPKGPTAMNMLTLCAALYVLPVLFAYVCHEAGR